MRISTPSSRALRSRRRTTGTLTLVRPDPHHTTHRVIKLTKPQCAESDASDISADDYEESLADRIAALADIVPPTYRKKLSSAADTTYDWATSGLSFSGKALWVISTSALLLGIPWALAFSEEQQMQEMEREMRMQQGANEVLTGGVGEQSARPAL
jgi:import receptor subunit TOM22